MSDLNYSRLPTNSDIISALLSEISKFDQPDNKSIIKTLAEQVEEIWNQSTIPIVSSKRIIKRIGELYTKYKGLKKWQGDHSSEIYDSKKKEFKNENDKILFDMCKCKCSGKCSCPYDEKIPLKEKDFIRDQRTERKMFFDKINKNETAKCEKKRLAEEKKLKALPEESKKKAVVPVRKEPRVRSSQLTPLPQKKKKLKNVANVLNARNVSYRLGTLICNAYSKDLNSRSESDIISPSFMCAEKQRARKKATEYHTQKLKQFIDSVSVFGLFFDGKKDDTFILVEDDETNHLHQRNSKQDHYTILFQPGDVYYGHITPNGSLAVDAARSICERLMKDDVNIEKLRLIGSDATAFNTGHLSGSI